MKKSFRNIHLWLALPFGIILFNLFCTGTILVFEDEWLHIFKPGRYYVEDLKDKKIPLKKLIPKICKQLPDSIQIESLTITSDKAENYTFGIKGIKHGEIKVDPYSGKIKDLNTHPEKRFFRTVRRLHRWLLLPHEKNKISWGRLITGISVIAFLFIITSGIIIWIPKNKKNLKTHLKIKWKPGGFRKWYDMHRVLGFYVAIFLLIFCLTGLTWSFQWYKNGVYKILGAEQNIIHKKETQKIKAPLYTNEKNNNLSSDGKYAIWDKVLERITKERKDFSLTQIQNNNVLVAKKGAYNLKIADQYTFNPNNGQIINITLAKSRKDKYSKTKKWIYDIHTGKWAGFTTKLLAFLACIGGIILTFTGYYIYFKKRWVNRN